MYIKIGEVRPSYASGQTDKQVYNNSDPPGSEVTSDSEIVYLNTCNSHTITYVHFSQQHIVDFTLCVLYLVFYISCIFVYFAV